MVSKVHESWFYSIVRSVKVWYHRAVKGLIQMSTTKHDFNISKIIEKMPKTVIMEEK